MKSLYLVIVLSLVWLLPESCSNMTENKHQTTDSITVTTPDISVTDFTSNDLSFFELHGHVKTLETEYGTMKFDKEGTLISVNGKDPFIEREVEGDDYLKYTRVAGFIVKEERLETTMEYVWQDGRLASSSWVSESWIGQETYKYNEKGMLVEMTTNQQDFGELPEVVVGKYSYDEFDDHHNWLQRTITANDVTVEERKIEYYND